MVKDPPEKKPCPCPKCKGALVSKRTIKRHQEHILPSANITSYEDWTYLEAGGSAGSSNTLAGGTASDEMSSDDENIYGRLSKRCRTGREIRPELVYYNLVPYNFFFELHCFISE